MTWLVGRERPFPLLVIIIDLQQTKEPTALSIDVWSEDFLLLAMNTDTVFIVSLSHCRARLRSNPGSQGFIRQPPSDRAGGSFVLLYIYKSAHSCADLTMKTRFTTAAVESGTENLFSPSNTFQDLAKLVLGENSIPPTEKPTVTLRSWTHPAQNGYI